MRTPASSKKGGRGGKKKKAQSDDDEPEYVPEGARRSGRLQTRPKKARFVSSAVCDCMWFSDLTMSFCGTAGIGLCSAGCDGLQIRV